MTPNSNQNKRLPAVLLPLAALLAMAAGVADAATDLANVPLANANTLVIHPNIAFVLDDSGSMNEENMPDDGDTNDDQFCYKWYKYNTLAYNPAITYPPPIKADGTRFPNSTFSNALKDGYFGATAKQFDGVTTNGYTNLNSMSGTVTTSATIKFNDFGSTKYNVSSVKVTLLDGSTIELMKTSPEPDAGGTTNVDDLGTQVKDSINANTSVHGFSATYSNSSNNLTIKAPASQFGLTGQPAITRNKKNTGSDKNVTITNFNSTATSFYYSTHKTDPNSTDCDPNNDYSLALVPSDIAAPGVTAGSAAALTNYANWYTYYRKRIFLAKAGVGEAFAQLDQDKYRIGLFFINSIESGHSFSPRNHDLEIAGFTGNTAGTHRATWFDRLYATRSGGSTPLRRSLSRMGRMYAGQISGWDPVQYSCQRNYTILSTDGYWNDTVTPKKIDGTNIGDQDSTADAPEKDKFSAENTLADVAYYYYHTDLRPGSCASPDVCTNNVPGVGQEKDGDDFAQHQHMTTFTVGFGVNGSLTYTTGYKTSMTGDFYDITQSTKHWPHPTDGSNDDANKIDDLWHAAVNGHGTYLSAKDPETLSDGLTSALNAIKSATGSGAAAATSNLQPTPGDNAIYIATYRTVHWDGELNAYSVNLKDGVIASTPTWEASPLLNARIGTSGDSDTRTIYTADGTTRTLFKAGAGGLTAAQLAYFDNTKLPQYSDWDADMKADATPSLLVDYLRGQDRHEDLDRGKGYGAYHRLYRDREFVLGDIIHAQPIYVKAPPYNFTDSGYFAFKSGNLNRAGTVYAASNDGMLHAFDAETGEERWAYVPPLVLPEMWRLASTSYGYGDNHRYFLDGPLTMADAVINGGWKTVLIGALGKGGRGYYALDVTDPADPRPLWTFSADNDPNVGYSFGIPIVTKLADGTWVALVTSGYNNVPEGAKYASADGVGRLFVLKLSDGTVMKTISTGAGSVADPSGLARINIRVHDFSTNNTALAAYGGDLLGNMWRFDLEAGTATKLASFGSNKPIMAAPEVAEISGTKVVYFGTGRYLGTSDLEDSSTQSIYAVKDDGSTTLTGTSNLIRQTLTTSDDIRSVTKHAVNWGDSAVFGWYIDLPDARERIALDLQLYAGTLVATSVVPKASECSPGGYSWLYQLDYKTGGYVGQTSAPAATQSTSPYVGVTVSKLPGGTPVIYPISADGKITKPVELRLDHPTAIGEARRVIWRELFD